VLGNLRVLYRVGSLVGLTDGQLLERFRSASSAGDLDAAEAALTALVERHAAMVWGVSRSLIRDPHDAEDAFQATFLILVRKAGSLCVRETIGGWLHVVAYRTALGVRASAARRRQVERTAAVGEAIEPHGREVPSEELGAAIHAGIMTLPEAFRAVVVLCDVEGLSYLEAAGRLKIPLGTVQSRLARARRRLRRDLLRRGIHPSDKVDPCHPSGAAGLACVTVGGPAGALVGRVGRLGAVIASDPTSLTTIVAGSVQALIKGGLRTMWLGTLRRVVVTSLGVVLVGGTVVYTNAGSGQTEAPAGRQGKAAVETERRIEMPAPRALNVAAGRGKAVLYALDDKGERIPERPEAKEGGPFRQTQPEIHWAVVTGVIDHDRVQKWFIADRRRPLPPADQLYRRVDLERQTLNKDGSWSRWRAPDADANLGLLDNLPVVEEEQVPERFLVGSLVDPLPVLTLGSWRGVNVEEFVPRERKDREVRPPSPLRHLGPHREWPPALMLRSFDFTVEPARTYRYRARVVLFNPDYDGRRSGDRKLILGPWSAGTDIVTIPMP
jgi:RNA polymerase sigma factor (sigma-70 family)